MRPAADAGADGQINESVQPLGRAPFALGQSRAIDVGIKADGQVKCSPQRADKIDIGPAGFGCGGDKAECG